MAFSLNFEYLPSFHKYSMTSRALAPNLRLKTILLIFPFVVIAMKLGVMLHTALTDWPTISATLKDGKYLLETRF
jgi:hypothetical protein